MKATCLIRRRESKQQPYGTGRRFGEEELTQLKEALIRTLCSTGRETKSRHCAPSSLRCTEGTLCTASSGTAAIHVALGALGVTEGDEVITSLSPTWEA